jgi:hypothetical protein
VPVARVGTADRAALTPTCCGGDGSEVQGAATHLLPLATASKVHTCIKASHATHSRGKVHLEDVRLVQAPAAH